MRKVPERRTQILMAQRDSRRRDRNYFAICVLHLRERTQRIVFFTSRSTYYAIGWYIAIQAPPAPAHHPHAPPHEVPSSGHVETCWSAHASGLPQQPAGQP